MPDAEPRALDAAAALVMLSELTGAPYELVGRLRGGETGAHEAVGPSGERLVVKWDQDPNRRAMRTDAVLLAERLRLDAGWPVPRQWVIDGEGCGFFIQSFLPGEPVTRLTHRLVDALVDLHEARLGLARSHETSTWPANLLATLTVGGDGYCRHDSLRDFGDRTAKVVAQIEDYGASLDARDFPRDDVVHWDLHEGNLLADCDGGLVGIVDTDFMLVGDARFDLVTLFVSSLECPCEDGVAERLRAAALEQLGEPLRTAYLAHMLLRCLDWSIRKERIADASAWLRHAEALLEL